MAREQEPESGLNPIGAADNGSIFAVMQIYDQLVEVGPGAKPGPGLAKSWSSSADKMTWTFKLRRAKFSNGDPVTAEDAAYSVNRFANPEVNTFYAALGSSIDSAKAVDAKTVEVKLKRVDGAFLDNMAMFVASVVPRKVVEKVGNKAFGEKPVGSGPFQVKEFARGQRLVLTRNPNYWRKGQPYLDEVRMNFVKDANLRVLQARNGEADVSTEIPYNQIKGLDGAQGVGVQVSPAFKWDAVWLNTTNKPLDDKKVRQALNYATPKEAIRKSILFGSARIANNIIADVKYNDDSVKPYPYDIDKAKQLISESASPDGFELPMAIASGDPVESQTAAVLKQEWKKIGVDVQVKQQDIGSLFTDWLDGKGVSASFPGNSLSSDTLSDDNLAFVFLDPDAGAHSFGTNYDNPEVVKLIKQANGTTDESERARRFGEAQKLALDDAPAVPLFFTQSRTAVRDTVKDFTTYKTGWWPLRETFLAG